jgi:hypothetical protein
VLSEWREAKSQLEDVDAFKGRLDGLVLRVNSQDTALKALERSTSALRQEYTTISQATDSQSVVRIDAVERGLARLEAAFQDFSSRLERRLDDIERSNAVSDLMALSTPYEATVLTQAGDDLPALSRVLLYLPLSKEPDGSVSMQRRHLDASGRPAVASVRIQTAVGEPLVYFG